MKFGKLIDEESTGKWHILEAPMSVDLRPEYKHLPVTNFEIPAGFTTDFASLYLIPCPRSWLIDTEKPAVLHDWQYQHGKLAPDSNLKVSRQLSDEIFHAGLIAEGVGTIRALTIWGVIRLWGWIPWRRYRGEKP